VPEPTFITPTNQGQVDTARPFVWSALPGASEYCLTVGTAPGTDDLVNSGPLAAAQTSFQVPALPTGRLLYARIYSAVNGNWGHADVTFSVAPTQAALTWPADGAAGVDVGRPFTWSRVPWATNYWLTIGTTEGASDVLNTGPLPAGQTSYSAIPPMPVGVPLHARLLTSDGANWTYADVTFTAAGRPS
jgi:hypothetical protein